MRIGIVAPPWVPVPPPTYGGTEAVVDVLARGLVAEGHQVELFTLAGSTCPVPRRWCFDEPPEPMGFGPAEAGHVLAAYEALDDVDLVHDHTALGPLLGRSVAPGRTVVTTCHLGFTPEVRRLVEATARAVPMIALSQAQVASAPEVPFVRVVHHGVDLERFPVGRGRGGYLLFLGRMSPDKGPDRAVRIARRAGVPLVVAAKMRADDELAYFHAEVEPLLGPGVDFVGEVGPAERARLIGGAAALLNPIRWSEPFGLVMVEALACGTPVLAAPTGAAPEIVDDGVTGFLCPDDDAFLAAAARTGELDRGACRAAAESRFSAGRMVRDHLALYAGLVGGTVVDLTEAGADGPAQPAPA